MKIFIKTWGFRIIFWVICQKKMDCAKQKRRKWMREMPETNDQFKLFKIINWKRKYEQWRRPRRFHSWSDSLTGLWSAQGFCTMFKIPCSGIEAESTWLQSKTSYYINIFNLDIQIALRKNIELSYTGAGVGVKRIEIGTILLSITSFASIWEFGF